MHQSPADVHHEAALRAVEELKASVERPLTGSSARQWASLSAMITAQLIALSGLAV